jgi:hypothetical protein
MEYLGRHGVQQFIQAEVISAWSDMSDNTISV